MSGSCTVCKKKEPSHLVGDCPGRCFCKDLHIPEEHECIICKKDLITSIKIVLPYAPVHFLIPLRSTYALRVKRKNLITLTKIAL